MLSVAGAPHERRDLLGGSVAVGLCETVGTQEYLVTRSGFLDRFTQAYGDAAAEEIAPLVRCARD